MLGQHTNYKLIVAYDGTRFFGWQKNNAGPSIEDALEKALRITLQQDVILQAASRTDRGVHAAGQVVNFFTEQPIDCFKLQYRLNQLLDDDIAILSLEQAPHDFHPTLHAKGKEYHYNIATGPILLPHLRLTHWHVPQIDSAQARQAALECVGLKDFKAFCNFRKTLNYESTIRTITRFDIIETAEGWRCEIEGDHFLYKMARNLVGTAIYAAIGKMNSMQVAQLFLEKQRTLAGITAPAHGLVLYKVLY